MKRLNNNRIKDSLITILTISLMIFVIFAQTEIFTKGKKVVASTEIESETKNETKVTKNKDINFMEEHKETIKVIAKLISEDNNKKIKEKINPKIDIPSYNIYDLRQVSNLSEEALSRILEGTQLQQFSSKFVECEEKYNINLLFVVAICALESSWGTSNMANTLNNLTGIGAFDGTGTGFSFNTKEDCIDSTFRLLAYDYLNSNGKHFNGFSVWNVNVKYCTTEGWAESIIKIMNQLK